MSANAICYERYEVVNYRSTAKKESPRPIQITLKYAYIGVERHRACVHQRMLYEAHTRCTRSLVGRGVRDIYCAYLREDAYVAAAARCSYCCTLEMLFFNNLPSSGQNVRDSADQHTHILLGVRGASTYKSYSMLGRLYSRQLKPIQCLCRFSCTTATGPYSATPLQLLLPVAIGSRFSLRCNSPRGVRASCFSIRLTSARSWASCAASTGQSSIYLTRDDRFIIDLFFLFARRNYTRKNRNWTLAHFCPTNNGASASRFVTRLREKCERNQRWRRESCFFAFVQNTYMIRALIRRGYNRNKTVCGAYYASRYSCTATLEGVSRSGAQAQEDGSDSGSLQCLKHRVDPDTSARLASHFLSVSLELNYRPRSLTRHTNRACRCTAAPVLWAYNRGAENICQAFGCRHDLLTNVQLLVTDPNDGVKVSLKKTSDRVRVSQRRIYFSLIIGVSFKCTCSRVCFK
ncbi:unnamed protein product [Trichogramma brassicae]|uniref:Uncharacterized protein n=1 Tax=Trichogramma brassicae TaxID=86971 RepID=A0A6H5I7Y8_9HYME|nr:unnamed protein product [Trichogramma brassicae]